MKLHPATDEALWDRAQDEKLRDVDSTQEWIYGFCGHEAPVDVERVQRYIGVGRPLSEFGSKELFALLLMKDDAETLAAKAELRKRHLQDHSKTIADIKWAYEDAMEEGPMEAFKAWRDQREAA